MVEPTFVSKEAQHARGHGGQLGRNTPRKNVHGPPGMREVVAAAQHLPGGSTWSGLSG